jgi:hypothetical protein
MIAFVSYKCFGPIDSYQRRLEGNRTVVRERDASSVVIPTILGTSSCELNIKYFTWLYLF